MDLRHVLLTRFNLPTAGREVAFRTRDGWLEQRVDLFARICLPSVAAQTEPQFDWIVYFDAQSPAWLRERVEELRQERDFHPCYTGLFDSGGWARTVREVIGPPQAGRWIITSNLDNDDALASDYIARVRAAARSAPASERYAINLPDGYVLCGARLFAHRHLQNAFTNLCEPDDGRLATTMTIRHMELADHVRVIQAEGAPGWVQFVHDSNVSNRIRGVRIAPQAIDGHFPPDLFAAVKVPSLLAGFAERSIAGPARALRDRIFAAIRRVVRVDSDHSNEG